MKDITGMRFGRLVAVRPVKTESRHKRFLFKCDCGAEKVIFCHSVTRGLTVSCGCYGREARLKGCLKHGNSGKRRTGTYNSWAGMMDRCEWGGHPSYARYGARGIRVCSRWHDFKNFLADMGERPKGMSIDRIDGRKGYSPDNCRWASAQQQALNTSRTIWVTHEEKRVTAHELCARLGISRKALRARASRRGNDYVAAFESLGIKVGA